MWHHCGSMQCKWKWLQNKKEKFNNQLDAALITKVPVAEVP